MNSARPPSRAVEVLVDELMEAARGLTSNTVCKLLERHVRHGVNYRGCGKREIFHSVARRQEHWRLIDGAPTPKSWLRKLEQELKLEPRPPSRKEQREAKKRQLDAEAAERRREVDEFLTEGGNYDEAIAQVEYQLDVIRQAHAAHRQDPRSQALRDRRVVAAVSEPDYEKSEEEQCRLTSADG